MPKSLPKSKIDYFLSYRIKDKIGRWSNWVKGGGKWLGLELVQNQIKMIRQNHSGDMEIKFEKDGKLLGFDGSEIGKAIEYKRR